ncbi:MAG: thermonuclease family protein [Bacillota bacterium]|nr:thermonuclease family protein [Bacillota bacterium]
MWKSLFALASLAIFLAAGCQLSPGDVSSREEDPDLLVAKVVRIIDGDTILVKVQGKEERVRFIGMDTPETVHPTQAVQPYGPEASAFTAQHLEDRSIYLELDVQERDRYGRLLAYIWLEKPKTRSDQEIRSSMLNAILLLEGYAQIMTVPPNVKYVDHFLQYQREAREGGKGLWGLDSEAARGGSVPGTGDEACPPGYPIKGNINAKKEKIYHVPGGAYYDRTKPKVCFSTEEEARREGFRPSQR